MKSVKTLTRRAFLRQSTMAAGALSVSPLVMSRAFGDANPSDKITVGAIGIAGRGRYILNAFLQYSDVKVVAVCDVFADRRNRAKQMVDEHYGNDDCAAYIDARELIARPDIDAVMIATGDNNHAPLSILAARAGKDIYCEKPMSVTIAESRAVSDAVRHNGRIFQCGTQRRNVGNFVLAVELARSGALGEIQTVYAEKAWPDSTIYYGVLPEEPLPPYEEMAWDLWLGPAAWRPYNLKYTTGFWRRHGDFSGSSIAEWGSHTVDLCQWALNADDTSPVHYRIMNELGDIEARYANGAKLVITKGLRFGSCPVRFEGTEGWVETGDDNTIETSPASLASDRHFSGGYPADNHVREFLNSVKSRQPTKSTAETSHRSITACHCANIAIKLKREVTWDPVKEAFVNDDEANRLRSRAYREPWRM
ncbi:MAG TPA: Gfo/Idh/MocA family oxidoreductase [Candidatus Hydrogenedentes bacterium]|nr:MAG: Inositol 2-dehydrogenase [Candidatus Hydrogenedentes bacterium ADurb.Bin170]HNZ48714.1 Gfo/Idh/MocA family oxidoreductase [Candidatus Hydrogenedentota bacterium]HPX85475.1 Gfo/Idh/MocA family oxidoreductase [Candidatus Hydrogenedentota bacterium]